MLVPVQSHCSPAEAESQAFLFGLKFAEELHLSSIIGGDAQCIVKVPVGRSP
uniref:RNase H type-1 domain-containing protein n=1 Tax=Nelumbo nucifera TaxID=4432 RepID=A0A822Z0T3_NELNU|nr:TPA_asm: hypothetical protein HUJ06_007726 [Nelumbo nucifera]